MDDSLFDFTVGYIMKQIKTGAFHARYRNTVRTFSRNGQVYQVTSTIDEYDVRKLVIEYEAAGCALIIVSNDAYVCHRVIAKDVDLNLTIDEVLKSIIF